MKHNFRDLTGQRFNRLTVIKLIQSASRKNGLHQSLWLCRCDCGVEKILAGGTFTRNNDRKVKSCGCLLKEKLASITRLDKGKASFNVLYYQYKKSAKERNYSFELTKEYFEKITKLNCHYCNTPPLQIKKCKLTNGYYIYNGIDRKNNEPYYKEENTLPCCKYCNFSKNTRTYDEFIEYLNRVTAFRYEIILNKIGEKNEII